MAHTLELPPQIHVEQAPKGPEQEIGYVVEKLGRVGRRLIIPLQKIGPHGDYLPKAEGALLPVIAEIAIPGYNVHILPNKQLGPELPEDADSFLVYLNSPESGDAKLTDLKSLNPGPEHTVLVGRSSKNDIQIKDPFVSRVHFGLRIIDLPAKFAEGQNSRAIEITNLSDNGTSVRVPEVAVLVTTEN